MIILLVGVVILVLLYREVMTKAEIEQITRLAEKGAQLTPREKQEVLSSTHLTNAEKLANAVKKIQRVTAERHQWQRAYYNTRTALDKCRTTLTKHISIKAGKGASGECKHDEVQEDRKLF